MLRRLALKDFVIVDELELEWDEGFSVLTGETGAGKSILLDAMQLVLGGRGDALVVREGASRAEIVAEFDAPPSLAGWLQEAGFTSEGESHADALLLRRVIDAQGRSRAWINGSAATVAQLREAADHLIEIHGQHAWQSLTRPPAVRALLDVQAGVDAATLAAAWRAWREAARALETARTRVDDAQREHDRLAWQLAEIDRLAPGDDEWDPLNAEHQRLAHAQSLLDAVQSALGALDEDEINAHALGSRAIDALSAVSHFDPRIEGLLETLHAAQAQWQDAARELHAYLGHADLDPERLAELDTRISAWMGLARRFRRPPAELAALRSQWQEELRALDAQSDLEALERAQADALARLRSDAGRASAARAKAAPLLAESVTQAMQQLGMAGGRFEVALIPEAEPQAHGLESVELRVAGHTGATPRALAKVASGGELSRLALAIAVTTAGAGEAGTLIFDEIDAGIGGAVADTVGRLMKQLGKARQVLAVTHLPQVAACGDHHFVVAKASERGITTSTVAAVSGEARVAEIARMLGGERLSGAGRAHAQEMLADAGSARAAARSGKGKAR